MDRFIELYLIDMKKTIESRNRCSDNRAYHIRTEKAEFIKSLLASKRITEADTKEALKLIGLKNL